MNCETCKDWGETIEEAQRLFHPEVGYVQCTTCLRWTYPNLGVNLPAGMAVAIGGTGMIAKLRQMGFSQTYAEQIAGVLPAKPDFYDKREALLHGQRQREEAGGVRSGDLFALEQLPRIVAISVPEPDRSRIRQRRGV